MNEQPTNIITLKNNALESDDLKCFVEQCDSFTMTNISFDTNLFVKPKYSLTYNEFGLISFLLLSLLQIFRLEDLLTTNQLIKSNVTIVFQR